MFKFFKMSKRKIKPLCSLEKLNIVREFENNVSVDELMKKYSIRKSKAEKAVDILYRFFESSENADACNLNIFESIYEIEKNIRKVDNCKQTKITNYFKPL